MYNDDTQITKESVAPSHVHYDGILDIVALTLGGFFILMFIALITLKIKK